MVSKKTMANDRGATRIEASKGDVPFREASSGERSYIEAMVANTPDAVIVLDQHFHIQNFNAAASRALGWSYQDTPGRGCAEVLKCRNLNRMELCGTSSCPLVRVLENKQPLPNEELILSENCEASVSVTPILQDEDVHVVFTARDLSGLKVANQVRANFVSMVSHELRTPLNSVHGFIDLLLLGHMGKLTSEQHTYLSYASEGVDQLMSLVEDILLMTRSDVGQFEMKQQEVNFRVLVRQVLNSIDAHSRKNGVILIRDIPTPSPHIYADPQRMKQVLNNLVANAIKFSPPGGTVTVRVQGDNERFVRISVTDSGFGIPQEDRPHVFERFYQSNHSLQSKMGGYGLGLAIARLIVEQHGGTIHFESSRDGSGTTFYFTVPLYTGQDKGE